MKQFWHYLKNVCFQKLKIEKEEENDLPTESKSKKKQDKVKKTDKPITRQDLVEVVTAKKSQRTGVKPKKKVAKDMKNGDKATNPRQQPQTPNVKSKNRQKDEGSPRKTRSSTRNLKK